MKTSFIEDCVNSLNEKGTNYLNTIIVVPSKRMGLFFQKALAKEKPNSFYPRIITPNELLPVFLEDKIINTHLSSLFLFEVYKEIVQDDMQLKDFMKWSNSLLNDFNEMDLYLLDTNDFFSYLADVKRIEQWNIGGEPATEVQLQYLKFWEEMKVIYERFNASLSEKKYSYTGKAYRQLAQLSVVDIQSKIEEQIVFVGFNAISLAESKFFNQLIEATNGLFYVDGDDYYLKDSLQEAGHHLRRQKIKNRIIIDSNGFKEGSKKINIYALPQPLAQAKFVANSFIGEDKAIIFNEESLLVPFLSGLPDSPPPMNISMGMPLHQTQLFSLLKQILEIQLDYKAFQGQKIYHKYFTSVLRNEILNEIIVKEGIEVENIIKKITKENLVFIDLEVDVVIKGRLKELLSPWDNNANKVLEQLYLFCDLLQHTELDDFIKSQFTYLLKVLDEAKAIIDEINFDIEKIPFIQILIKLLRKEKLDLLGEPLEGMQVLGMLESRGLDFDEVVMLSVNEELMPAKKQTQTVIPQDIKGQFGLPTQEDRDAIYAYYFYRLIQRASTVHLVYHTASEGLQNGEKSRFISQIIEELPSINSQIEIREYPIDFPVINREVTNKELDKSDLYLSRVNQWMENKVSPSALNTFLNCSLDFYYSYVLKLKEVEDVDEAITASAFGTVLHDTLENLYKPFLAKNVTSHDFNKMEIQAETLLKTSFSKFYKSNYALYGKNRLSLTVAKHYLSRFLKSEKSSVALDQSLEIVGIEEKIEIKKSIDGSNVNFYGVVDRIDRLKGSLRVIDYKSGKVESKDISVKGIEDLRDKPKAFQLMFYAWTYYQKYDVIPDIVGNISFVNLSQGIIPLKINKETSLSVSDMEAFENLLVDIIREIKDRSSVLSHNEKALYCEFC